MALDYDIITASWLGDALMGAPLDQGHTPRGNSSSPTALGENTRVAGSHRGGRAADMSSPVGTTRRKSTTTVENSGRSKKRNKPTLNCLECVERKSKCDRGRPSCFTCIRRQTTCRYTHIADVIAAKSSDTSRKRRRSEHTLDRIIRPGPCSPGVGVNELQANTNAGAEVTFFAHPNFTHGATNAIDSGVPVNNNVSAGHANASARAVAVEDVEASNGSNLQQELGNGLAHIDETDHGIDLTTLFASAIDTLGPMMLPSPATSTSRPRERHALLNLFGAACVDHPFQNYWTDAGGLVEVVSSLPSRPEAEALIDRFFSSVDPIYPVVPRDVFVADIERFWQLTEHDKQRHDPAQIALQFAVYANGAYDSSLQTGHEAQLDTASFYLSCCHQSLCISSYLNRWSLMTIQTMILICHFMIATNRIADAWTISGIVQRQSYCLKLNRNPEDLGLRLEDETVQVRLRLWQAAMLQDTLLSLRLKRPPSTTYFNVSHHDLRPLQNLSSHGLSDVAYARAMWQCSVLIQETVCSPLSDQQPLVTDAAHKSRVIARYRELYSRLEEPFCFTTPDRFDQLPPRLLYQMATVASTYFHALTLVFTERNEKGGAHADPCGAIRAAHEGMSAFFALVRLSTGHIRVWAAAHNRTYAMAAVIGTMLILHKRKSVATRRLTADDPELMLGKSDLDRYISMLERAQGSAEFRVIQRERLANLKTLQAAAQDA